MPGPLSRAVQALRVIEAAPQGAAAIAREA